MMSDWSYGAVLRAVEAATPENAIAHIHGEQSRTWAELATRSNNLASNLLAAGIKPGEKVAFYMRNCLEYSECLAAVFKGSFVHVNVNYRYIDQELVYLLDNSDAAVVFYQHEFQDHVDEIKTKLPRVKLWLCINADKPAANAVDQPSYSDLVTTGGGARPKVDNSPDDLLFMYTGGTTGMPKGVMWRHSDLILVMGAGGDPFLGIAPCADLEALEQRVRDQPRPVVMPLPPLMHGTGLTALLTALVSGGTTVTLGSKNFDPILALQKIQEHKVNSVSVVGDSFAKPMLEALDAKPGHYDISTLSTIKSAGVMWTADVKKGLLRHNENLLLSDILASSEAVGLGASLMSKNEAVEVAKFSIGPNCKVFNERFEEVKPGSDETGMVAVAGYMPLGYYKDQEKTDKTFKTVKGVRYSIPGDWVKVEANGELTLLGRGSHCINTGGEKVFPEEVEEALKTHEDVDDALVIGVADEKWGQAIVAVVQLRAGSLLDEVELRNFCRSLLAAYKLPKRIFAKACLERAANGKADYELIKTYVAQSI